MTQRKSSVAQAVILTGLSGSGKTVALNAFEDSGFFCVDNLPTMLIESFVNLCRKTPTMARIAIGVDIRERRFLSDFSHTVSALRKKQKIDIIFLEATREVLMRRFKETRRPHPLGLRDLKKALTKELALLDPIKQEADRIIDTSSLTPHQLRRLITKAYDAGGQAEMTIGVMTFGYKYGIPMEADLLFDVRFLPNPFFIDDLRALTGTSRKVKDFVFAQKDTNRFFKKLTSLLNYLIPLYQKEGRSYLTVGIGCTGGRHRSPALAVELTKVLKKKGLEVALIHRDLGDT